MPLKLSLTHPTHFDGAIDASARVGVTWHLLLCVAKLGEVVDAVQHSTLVGDTCVQVVLLAGLVDREALQIAESDSERLPQI